jgi:hypothetical protein
MMKKSTPDNLLWLMMRAQKLAHQEACNSGYAMMMTSILGVMMFSLLAAYLTMSNITKSASNAFLEGNSSFYAAESGLNKRAELVRRNFIDYSRPSGDSPGVSGQPVTIANMAACMDSDTSNDGTGDFGCQQVVFNYQQAPSTNRESGLSFTDKTSTVKYTAFSFVADRTAYTDTVRKIPVTKLIPPGQTYEGLSAQEYIYTVYSTATTKEAQNLDARASTVLEMTFKSRLIPLFQFAAFYDGDLELNSTSQMDINGRIHTNGNLYAQPTPTTPTFSMFSIWGSSSTDRATTRLLGPVTVAGKIYNRVDAAGINRYGDTQVLVSGDANNPNASGNTYVNFPTFNSGRTSPLTVTEIASFQGKVKDETAGVGELKVPQPGFLRQYERNNKVGEYYGKADLRLEMVPKRTAGNVPFNFTTIKDGGSGGSCGGLNIDPNRQGTNLQCSQLNEGQLRSLMQPVMVKVTSDEERNRFCPSITDTYNPNASSDRVLLRSLQVGIAAQNTPVTLAQLNLPLDNAANAGIKSIVTSLNSSDTSKSPVQLAAEKGGCFLPTPIQTVTGNGGTNSNYNWQSGYYDRREQRWIGMLQTNLQSLTLWNRDGLYVARDNNFNTNDNPNTSQLNAAYNSSDPSSTYDTNQLLFLRAAANSSAPTGSFQKLGLAASDTTEGGLVFHAMVNQDLDGNGSTDLTVDPADNLRNYPDGKRKSPYGFAFNGGENLPGKLTVVTDQALYVQGNYNSFSSNAAKQPASLIGDTITVLSSSCLESTTQRLDCGITTGQRTATATTVNAAFLSYTDESAGNIDPNYGLINLKRQYSGGLNNYMRMTENWSGVNFNYRGSFVSLGTPQEFSGAYRPGCSTTSCFYNVPNRNFSYDIDFNAADKLPPLTPRVIYLQQEVFKRAYR